MEENKKQSDFKLEISPFSIPAGMQSASGLSMAASISKSSAGKSPEPTESDLTEDFSKAVVLSIVKKNIEADAQQPRQKEITTNTNLDRFKRKYPKYKDTPDQEIINKIKELKPKLKNVPDRVLALTVNAEYGRDPHFDELPSRSFAQDAAWMGDKTTLDFKKFDNRFKRFFGKISREEYERKSDLLREYEVEHGLDTPSKEFIENKDKRNWLLSAANSMTGSVAYGSPGFVAGAATFAATKNPITAIGVGSKVSGASAFFTYGMNAYYDFFDDLERAGRFKEVEGIDAWRDMYVKAVEEWGIQGGIEMVGDVVGGKILASGGVAAKKVVKAVAAAGARKKIGKEIGEEVLKKGIKAIESEASQATSKKVAKAFGDFTVKYIENAANEVTQEMSQGYLSAANRKRTGLETQDPAEAALSAIPATMIAAFGFTAGGLALKHIPTAIQYGTASKAEINKYEQSKKDAIEILGKIKENGGEVTAEIIDETLERVYKTRFSDIKTDDDIKNTIPTRGATEQEVDHIFGKGTTSRLVDQDKAWKKNDIVYPALEVEQAAETINKIHPFMRQSSPVDRKRIFDFVSLLRDKYEKDGTIPRNDTEEADILSKARVRGKKATMELLGRSFGEENAVKIVSDLAKLKRNELEAVITHLNVGAVPNATVKSTFTEKDGKPVEVREVVADDKNVMVTHEDGKYENLPENIRKTVENMDKIIGRDDFLGIKYDGIQRDADGNILHSFTLYNKDEKRNTTTYVYGDGLTPEKLISEIQNRILSFDNAEKKVGAKDAGKIREDEAIIPKTGDVKKGRTKKSGKDIQRTETTGAKTSNEEVGQKETVEEVKKTYLEAKTTDRISERPDRTIIHESIKDQSVNDLKLIKNAIGGSPVSIVGRQGNVELGSRIYYLRFKNNQRALVIIKNEVDVETDVARVAGKSSLEVKEALEKAHPNTTHIGGLSTTLDKTSASRTRAAKTGTFRPATIEIIVSTMERKTGLNKPKFVVSQIMNHEFFHTITASFMKESEVGKLNDAFSVFEESLKGDQHKDSRKKLWYVNIFGRESSSGRPIKAKSQKERITTIFGAWRTVLQTATMTEKEKADFIETSQNVSGETSKKYLKDMQGYVDIYNLVEADPKLKKLFSGIANNDRVGVNIPIRKASEAKTFAAYFNKKKLNLSHVDGQNIYLKHVPTYDNTKELLAINRKTFSVESINDALNEYVSDWSVNEDGTQDIKIDTKINYALTAAGRTETGSIISAKSSGYVVTNDATGKREFVPKELATIKVEVPEELETARTIIEDSAKEDGATKTISMSDLKTGDSFVDTKGVSWKVVGTIPDTMTREMNYILQSNKKTITRTENDSIEISGDINGVDFSGINIGAGKGIVSWINGIINKIKDPNDAQGNNDLLTRAGKKVLNFFFAFNQAREYSYELKDQMFKTYFGWASSAQRAINFNKRLDRRILTDEEAMLATLVAEDPNITFAQIDGKKVVIPQHIREEGEFFSKFLSDLGDQEMKEGILNQKWPSGIISTNEEKILSLLETKAGTQDLKKISKINDRIAKLTQENKILSNLRYVPRNVVALRIIENKLRSLKEEERPVFLKSVSDLSFKFKKRTTTTQTLYSFYRDGLLSKEDLNIKRIVIGSHIDYFQKSAIKMFYDYARDEGLIRYIPNVLKGGARKAYIMKNVPAGWVQLNQRTIGVRAPEYKDSFVHPIIASLYSEFKDYRTYHPSNFRSVLNMIKGFSFFNPTIIWAHDVRQHYFGGASNIFNIFSYPGEMKRFVQAYKIFSGGGELYDSLNKGGLFQQENLLSRSSEKEMMDIYLDKISDKSKQRFKGMLEEAIGRKIDNKTYKQAFKIPYMAMSRLTWAGDEIFRIWTYLSFRNLGFTHDGAIFEAAHVNTAYAEMSKQYKQKAGLVFFVHSFRLLMPLEMLRLYFREPITVIANKLKGKEVPKQKIKQLVNAYSYLFLAEAAIPAYMLARGWETDKWGWKWRKKVTVDGEEKELVVATGDFLQQFVKQYTRLSTYTPLDKKLPFLQGWENYMRYEIHPFWGVMLDIYRNKKYLGGGRIYDDNLIGSELPRDKLAIASQCMRYAFARWYKIGGFAEADVDRSDYAENKVNEAISQSVNSLEKWLWAIPIGRKTGQMSQGLAGYAYLRGNRDDYVTSLRFALIAERRERLGELRAQARRGMRQEILEKRYDALNKWTDNVTEWIDKKVDTLEKEGAFK